MTTSRSGTVGADIGNTNSFAVAKPSGAVSGDLLVVAFSTEDDATVTCTTVPTGFTRVDGGTLADPVAVDTTGADMRGFAYIKTLTAADDTAGAGQTFTFGLSASPWVSWAAHGTDGASGAVVSTTVRTQSSVGGSNSASISAVTLSAGQLGMAFGAVYENGPFNSVTTWTEPTGSTRMNVYKTSTDATNRAFDNASGGSRWWAITLVLDAAGGGITGTAAVTLGAFTSAASGTYTPPPVTGTVAVTLGLFTSTASGVYTPPPITGSSAVTLAAFVAAASGTVAGPGITGTAAVTLAAFTSAASGTYTPPPITGTSAVTLGVFVAAGSGTASGPGVITGTVAVTLDAFVSSAAGTFTAPSVTGTAAPTLQPFTAIGAGTFTPAPITGTVAVTLGLFIALASDAPLLILVGPLTTATIRHPRSTLLAGHARTARPVPHPRTTEGG